MKREMEDLRQQLQLLKKQTMTALDQARNSSDSEQAALLQAQESLNLGKTATSKAARSAEHENYMFDLMTDASQDMAGALPFSFKLDKCFLSTTYYILLFFFGIGSFLDIAIKEQRVNLRVGGIMRLATEANVDFG
jgi:multidrug efflux pump subunit AcrA (membrane-fusion protein)